MPCATTLYFDLETDAAVRRLWQAIEDAGLPSSLLNLGYRPHLTLAVCETMNLEGLRDELLQLVAATSPIKLNFHGLGTFSTNEGVVYLGVTVNRALLDLHDQIGQLLGPHSNGNLPYYMPGVWVPHVTLGYGLLEEQVVPVLNSLRRSELPASGTVTELVVSDVTASVYTDLFVARFGIQ